MLPLNTLISDRNTHFAGRCFAMLAGLALLFMTSCSSSAKESEPEAPAKLKTKYMIAYNVLQFSEENKNDYEIITMELDGSNKKNVTNNPDVAWTYHAHGDRIFFISDRNASFREFYFYEMKYDGTELKKISPTRLGDSWMDSRKNGKELIVCPHDQADGSFYLMDRSGKVLERISPNTPFASDPTFSPDGKTIAFVGKNQKINENTDFEAEIYTCNLDGSNLKQLTTYPKDDKTAEWFAYKAGAPRWHPTENFISYHSKQNGKYSLYGVTPDGKKQWKLTDLTDNEGWHEWSPDGKWLALETSNKDQSQFHIRLMNWETKAITLLTESELQFQHAPVFLEIPVK